jgi:hypothetical protein
VECKWTDSPTMDSVPALKETQRFCVTHIGWLIQFREIVVIYTDNHMKPIKTTLLLYHTTGFDSFNGHHQVYIHKIKTSNT